jgi:hypothetical protein
MKMFECDKCNGSGKVHWKHIENGRCFKCGGVGKLKYNPRPNIPEITNEDNGEWFYNDRIAEGERGLLEWINN